MRLACVQRNVAFGDPLANAAHAAQRLKELGERGVDLAVFPECFLTGYCVGAAEEADEIAIERTHEAIETIESACEANDILAVVGFAEQHVRRRYNSAALFEPGEAPRFYRKTHLPCLGYDRFAKAGDEIKPFPTRLGRIGILICYDMRPPEAARSLALQGAELILLPTNWPEGAETSADHFAVVRAAENKVFVATCNRSGEENGFRFIGRSKIVDPGGRILAAAAASESTIEAEIDLTDARIKRTVIVPGLYELEIFGCRQPHLYRPLTEHPTGDRAS